MQGTSVFFGGLPCTMEGEAAFTKVPELQRGVGSVLYISPLKQASPSVSPSGCLQIKPPRGRRKGEIRRF